jgi:hypothetical protein
MVNLVKYKNKKNKCLIDKKIIDDKKYYWMKILIKK